MNKFDLSVLRDILREKKMTQVELAELIGRDNTSVSRIINTSRTNTETLEKIANALNVSLSIFLGEIADNKYERFLEISAKLNHVREAKLDALGMSLFDFAATFRDMEKELLEELYKYEP